MASFYRIVMYSWPDDDENPSWKFYEFSTKDKAREALETFFKESLHLVLFKFDVLLDAGGCWAEEDHAILIEEKHFDDDKRLEWSKSYNLDRLRLQSASFYGRPMRSTIPYEPINPEFLQKRNFTFYSLNKLYNYEMTNDFAGGMEYIGEMLDPKPDFNATVPRDEKSLYFWSEESEIEFNGDSYFRGLKINPWDVFDDIKYKYAVVQKTPIPKQILDPDRFPDLSMITINEYAYLFFDNIDVLRGMQTLARMHNFTLSNLIYLFYNGTEYNPDGLV